MIMFSQTIGVPSTYIHNPHTIKLPIPHPYPGGALLVSIAQNIFTNKLISWLSTYVLSISPLLILSAGVTSLKDVVEPQFLGGVLFSYNETQLRPGRLRIATQRSMSRPPDTISLALSRSG
ncbi:hypothetical protein B0H17DRAFT_1133139 [Mycena rosella]|uniref:Uncharacterized protein n=1 Tax=Mycena rosella TaxID=1033263 RepID=A0AAD7GIG0_MYCRO|nr:hypothetical protein B0H17DRAFT_1133139 [Mycena rosella]